METSKLQTPRNIRNKKVIQKTMKPVRSEPSAERPPALRKTGSPIPKRRIWLGTKRNFPSTAEECRQHVWRCWYERCVRFCLVCDSSLMPRLMALSTLGLERTGWSRSQLIMFEKGTTPLLSTLLSITAIFSGEILGERRSKAIFGFWRINKTHRKPRFLVYRRFHHGYPRASCM